MTARPALIPPRHPPYKPLETILQRFLGRLGAAYRARLGHGMPRGTDFRGHAQPLADLCRPLIADIYLRAGRQTMRGIAQQFGEKSARWRVKRIPTPALDFAFDLFNPRILQAIDEAALAFAQSTLDTLTVDVRKWEDKFRQELREGLESGEGVRDLGIRIGRLIADPNRAFRAGVTEASRAVHAGEILAAKQSGVADKKQWLASSDACDLCLELHGKIVGLDEAFHVDAKGEAYAAVYHPPRHPFCMCSEKILVNYDMVEDGFVLTTQA